MEFNKESKSVDQHIELLQSRGMLIRNPDAARHSLSHINYYRLSGYWLIFEEDHKTHQFKTGTEFEAVLNLYIFDRKLRLLILDAIEYVEVSLRRQWAHSMAEHYGPHGYLKSDLARKKDFFDKNLNDLKNEFKRSEEVFIKHYKNTYSSPNLPPIWSVCEIMSLGLLSRWFKNLQSNKIRKEIARTYKLNDEILGSFIHHLTIVRNICAHHSRLWNSKFTVTVKLPSKPKNLSINLNQSQERRLYNTLVILIWILNIVNPRNSWSKQILDLIDSHEIDVSRMGFPESYRTYSIWTNSKE